jgi:hypothetical protein
MLHHVALVRTDISKELSSVHQLLVRAKVVPSSLILVTLMMEALSSSETSVLTRVTWHNIPEDTILHSHCHENLKSYTENNCYINNLIIQVITKPYFMVIHSDYHSRQLYSKFTSPSNYFCSMPAVFSRTWYGNKRKWSTRYICAPPIAEAKDCVLTYQLDTIYIIHKICKHKNSCYIYLIQSDQSGGWLNSDFAIGNFLRKWWVTCREKYLRTFKTSIINCLLFCNI